MEVSHFMFCGTFVTKSYVDYRIERPVRIASDSRVSWSVFRHLGSARLMHTDSILSYWWAVFSRRHVFQCQQIIQRVGAYFVYCFSIVPHQPYEGFTRLI